MAIGYNEFITFGRNGTARALKCSGIDFDEDGDRSWTSAPVVELDVPLSIPRQEVFLEISASAFTVPDKIASQQVFVFVGGMFASFYLLETSGTKVCPVNRQAMVGRELRITLVIPTATSPMKLGLGEDKRELGLYLSSMLFTAKS